MGGLGERKGKVREYVENGLSTDYLGYENTLCNCTMSNE